MARIGVFVCHCGENIGRTVRAGDVAKFARRVPGTVYAADYPYFCSAPGQKILAEAIKEHDLTGVVVAACSPQLHWPTSGSSAPGSTRTRTRRRPRRAGSSPRPWSA
jgi:heterodisulfide reductase subunit A